jgi:NitT/TauT family transport system substrate-binding protein
MRAFWAFAAALTVAASGTASAQDKVTFGTDWKAQAEHGGFYQAIATGIYKKYGLEVTLRPGGPQVNHAQLLAAGRLDFNMTPDSFGSYNFVRENIPMVAVAALFQKDPKVIISHAGVGNDNLPALKGKPIMIGSDTRAGMWLFLKSKFGYTDDQIRPYNFNVAPFLADKTASQQGYLTSEPLMIIKAGGRPVPHLIADYGYSSYAAIVQTSQKLVSEKPDLVQRFVNASIEGWYSYTYGDPKPGNALIKKDNPEMTDELIDYGHGKLREYGVIDSGDSTTLGIGAMTEARWKDFFDTMSAQGVYPAGMDWKKAYTLQFVNKKVGIELKK